MEVMRIFVTIVCFLLNCDSGQCFIGDIAGRLAGLGHTAYCQFKECCTDKYIPADFTLLDSLLNEEFYGQHLAHETVLYAVQSHVKTKKPTKALAMSFHGLPGTGKNYLADFIVKALYKEGEKSKYVRYYRGRLQFPSDGLIEQYQDELQKNIIEHLKACPRSIFIFDEVEKIPKSTLDVLVPFIDYHPKIRGADATQAIFIFLSNTGGTEITKTLLQMWHNGKKRKEAKLQDFEPQLALAAFNEKGGFHKSDTIDSSLIDHYVPFLPLEKGHVIKCIIDAFKRRGLVATNEQIDEVMTHVTFGPPEYELYSTAGCKRLDQKIGHIIYRDNLQTVTSAQKLEH